MFGTQKERFSSCKQVGVKQLIGTLCESAHTHTQAHTHTNIYERQKSRTTCFTIVIVIVRGLLSESPNVNCKNISHASNCRINRVRGNKDRERERKGENEKRQEDTSSANSIMSTGL